MSKKVQSRNFCFTLNNYTDLEVENVKKTKCRFIQFGKEIGEEGTPHLQGFVCFESAKTLSAVKKCLQTQRVHLEIARGNVEQNLAYTGKDGDIFRSGDPPKTQKEKGDMEKDRWDTILSKAQDGDWAYLQSEHPHEYAMYEQKFIQLRATHLSRSVQSNQFRRSIWIYGPPGTGKSAFARVIADSVGAGLYVKGLNKWFCGYADKITTDSVTGQSIHPTMLIEDVSPVSVLNHAQQYKVWTDIYGFTGETKGGIVSVSPTLVIVTSNYTIDQCFSGVDLPAIRRRFDVYRMDSSTPDPILEFNPDAIKDFEKPKFKYDCSKYLEYARGKLVEPVGAHESPGGCVIYRAHPEDPDHEHAIKRQALSDDEPSKYQIAFNILKEMGLRHEYDDSEEEEEIYEEEY